MALLFDSSGVDLVFGNSGVGNTIYGGATSNATWTGNDNLGGAESNDSVFGLDGNDFLFGGDANDLLVGGAGNDFLAGGNGTDVADFEGAQGFLIGTSNQGTVVFANGETDILSGLEEIRNLAPLAAAVTLTGFSSAIAGTPLADTITAQSSFSDARGLSGNDTLIGGPGFDSLYGGADADTIQGNGATDLVYGGDGSDRLYGGADSDVVGGGAGADTLYGGDNNDVLWGGAGTDVVYGGTGNDALYADDDNDVLYGGDGNDRVLFRDQAELQWATSHMSTSGNVSTITWQDGGRDTLYDVEQFFYSGSVASQPPPDDPYFVNALEVWVHGIHRPAWNLADGQPATVTYSFMSSVPTNENVDTSNGNPFASFQPFDAELRDMARQALAAWSAVSGVTFVEISSANEAAGQRGMIEFGRHQMSAAGYAEYPAIDAQTGQPPSGNAAGNIFLDVDLGQSSWMQTLLHEIGHALGLQHPHDQIVRLPRVEDDNHYTVMSYANQAAGGQLGLFDVAVIQHLYGINPAARSGNDTYAFGTEHLIWDGGGDDLIDASGSDAAVHVDLAEGSWSWIGNGPSELLTGTGQVLTGHGTEIERLVGSVHGDWLAGNELPNSIFGGEGNDTAYGNAGDDHLVGGAGLDRLYGGAGTDTAAYLGAPGIVVTVGSAKTVLLAGGEQDLLYDVEVVAGLSTFTSLGSGDDTQIFTPARDVVDGLAGNDRIGAGSTGDLVFGNSGQDILLGDAGDDTLKGGTSGDMLLGGGEADQAFGESGADVMTGGPGIDTLTGGAGDDLLLAEDGDDTAYGDAADDAVDGGQGNDRLQGGDGNDLVGGGAGNDTIHGDAADDWLAGDGFENSPDGGDDWIFGGAGNDVIRSGGGADTAFGGAGNDLVRGGDGADELLGESGNDDISGDGGDDRVDGGAGNDLVSGGDGQDTLLGNAGDDTLAGGAGNDTFIFHADGGADLVVDWNDGDTILIDSDVTSSFDSMLRYAIPGGMHVGTYTNPTPGAHALVGIDILLDAGETLDATDFVFL